LDFSFVLAVFSEKKRRQIDVRGVCVERRWPLELSKKSNADD
jgi:hypothetical protein